MKCISLYQLAFCKLGFSFTFILILSACVTVEKHPMPVDSELNRQAMWEAHKANLQTLHSWELKGRVAGKSNDQGFRAGVNWSQKKHDFAIKLHGPLGRKVAVITGKPGNVQLKTSKGESFVANDPEKLIQELFGYTLPVNGLRYWLLGVPDPKQAQLSIQLDEHGRLIRLEQAEWVIDYNRYHSGTTALPALMQISNVSMNANIKIDHWQLN